jgi:hypothetical protein
MDILAGLLRYALSWIGVYLVSRGYLTDGDLSTLQGTIEVVGTAVLTAGPPAYYVVKSAIARRRAASGGGT